MRKKKFLIRPTGEFFTPEFVQTLNLSDFGENCCPYIKNPEHYDKELLVLRKVVDGNEKGKIFTKDNEICNVLVLDSFHNWCHNPTTNQFVPMAMVEKSDWTAWGEVEYFEIRPHQYGVGCFECYVHGSNDSEHLVPMYNHKTKSMQWFNSMDGEYPIDMCEVLVYGKTEKYAVNEKARVVTILDEFGKTPLEVNAPYKDYICRCNNWLAKRVVVKTNPKIRFTIDWGKVGTRMEGTEVIPYFEILDNPFFHHQCLVHFQFCGSERPAFLEKLLNLENVVMNIYKDEPLTPGSMNDVNIILDYVYIDNILKLQGLF
jgi:hypothetical protein